MSGLRRKIHSGSQSSRDRSAVKGACGIGHSYRHHLGGFGEKAACGKGLLCHRKIVDDHTQYAVFGGIGQCHSTDVDLLFRQQTCGLHQGTLLIFYKYRKLLDHSDTLSFS